METPSTRSLTKDCVVKLVCSCELFLDYPVYSLKSHNLPFSMTSYNEPEDPGRALLAIRHACTHIHAGPCWQGRVACLDSCRAVCTRPVVAIGLPGFALFSYLALLSPHMGVHKHTQPGSFSPNPMAPSTELAMISPFLCCVPAASCVG